MPRTPLWTYDNRPRWTLSFWPLSIFIAISLSCLMRPSMTLPASRPGPHGTGRAAGVWRRPRVWLSVTPFARWSARPVRRSCAAAVARADRAFRCTGCKGRRPALGQALGPGRLSARRRRRPADASSISCPADLEALQHARAASCGRHPERLEVGCGHLGILSSRLPPGARPDVDLACRVIWEGACLRISCVKILRSPPSSRAEPDTRWLSRLSVRVWPTVAKGFELRDMADKRRPWASHVSNL